MMQRKALPTTPMTDGDTLPDEQVFGSFSFPRVEIPKDKDGFTQSFQLSQKAEYLEFFNRYGFVVIDNVLDRPEVDATIDEIWKGVEAFDWTPYNPALQGNRVNRNDSRTWGDNFFPTSREGFFGLVLADGPQSFRNRQNARLYEAFQTIFHRPSLWVSIDRYGIMRPTRNVSVGALEPNPFRSTGLADETLPRKDFPEWKTIGKWLHWDLNPWIWASTNEGIDYFWDDDFIQENNGTRNEGEVKLQGFINLVDNREGDGGFLCVPGFNCIINEYVEKTKKSAYAKKHAKEYAFAECHSKDYLQEHAQKVALRAGSLLIWSSELPHCNYPNDSDRFRMVQYVKMFGAQEGGKGTDKRAVEVERLLRPIKAEVTPLGRKMFGLDSWKQ